MEKQVYMVQTIWSTSDDSGVDTFIFSTYKKALNSFYNSVNDELENAWVSDYVENGKFDDSIVHTQVNFHRKDGIELYRQWKVEQRYDQSYSTEIILDIMELL